MSDRHATAPQAAGKGSYAHWGLRVGATILDAIPVIVIFVLCLLIFGHKETTDNSFSVQLKGSGALVYYLLAFLFFVYNTLYLQGTRGQSIGKKIVGIAVYRAGTSEPIGPGLTVGRQLLHILDGIPCLLGYLWPLWDKENRTFADMIVSSRAYTV